MIPVWMIMTAMNLSSTDAFRRPPGLLWGASRSHSQPNRRLTGLFHPRSPPAAQPDWQLSFFFFFLACVCVFFLLIDLYCVNQGTCPWSVTHQQLTTTTTTTTTQAAITKKKTRFLFCRLLQVQCFRQSENTSLVAENQKNK